MRSAFAPSTVVRPSTVQVYSRMRETNDTCPAPVPLSSDPHSSDLPKDLSLPIVIRKSTHTCEFHTPLLILFPMVIYPLCIDL